MDMTNRLTIIPKDIFISEIVPHLGRASLYNVSRTCNAMYRAVRSLLTVLRVHNTVFKELREKTIFVYFDLNDTSIYESFRSSEYPLCKDWRMFRISENLSFLEFSAYPVFSTNYEGGLWPDDTSEPPQCVKHHWVMVFDYDFFKLHNKK